MAGPLDFMEKTNWGERYTRKPPVPDDRPLTLIDREKRKRMHRDAEYNATSDIYKEENPDCVRCGNQFEPKGLETDHIVCGVAGRSASLLNADTWVNQCHECHPKQWSIIEKIIAKLLQVLRAIERCRGKRLDDKQFETVIEGLKRGRDGR